MPKILFLTCLIQMISMVGFAIWPIYLIDLQLQWELSNSEAGWVSGSFYIGYVVATPFLVSLTDTFDARKLYSISKESNAIYAEEESEWSHIVEYNII